MNEKIEKLKGLTREVKVLSNIGAALGWDQETYMPESAIGERAEQIALVQGFLHTRMSDPEVGRLLEDLGCSRENPGGNPELDSLSRAFCRTVYREYSRSVKLPERLVTDLARSASLAQAAWIKSRKENDFSSFAPHLEKMLALNLEKADCLEYEEHPYDALIDEYEPWMKTTDVRRVFTELKEYLKGLVARIGEADQVDDGFLLRKYPVEKQEVFGRIVLSDMGFDFSRGRLDVSAHPFTTSLGCDDVRITTRYNPTFFKTSIFGIIHEAGHALYELGFGDEIKGNILAEGTSLGIHESQSRTWENMVGRSKAFWEGYLPELKNLFPEQLDGVDVNSFYRAVNKVEPSLIRVEADEVTYSMHIILRFELETALLEKNLSVRDLPAAWNDGMKDLLGVVPGNDADGVLQDIHWSMGAFGYFPTYALGNLYGAQFFRAMEEEITDLHEHVKKRKLSPILSWLREHVHSPGAIFTASELIKRVTGEELSTKAYTRYLEEKYANIYELPGM